jgi:thioredoxin reductase (NADPH)
VEKVVLATGGTARPRLPYVPGEDLPHVSHYFRDAHEYFGKKLVIVVGKNSAVEAALRCHNAGAQVTLVHRREKLPEKSIKYWLLPEINGLCEAGKIAGCFETVVKAITPSEVVTEGPGGAQRIEADFVLLLVGYEADMSLCRMAGVELVGNGQKPVFDEKTMETNVAGVYVAGTATAGTQEGFKVFIENSHVHVERILGEILGKRIETHEAVYATPES